MCPALCSVWRALGTVRLDPLCATRVVFQLQNTREGCSKKLFKKTASAFTLLSFTTCMYMHGFTQVCIRAGNEQGSLFGKHVSVFVVLFCVRFLNVFGIVFGCVRCSVFGPCYVLFGVRFRCCVVFGVRASQLSESCPDDHV